MEEKWGTPEEGQKDSTLHCSYQNARIQKVNHTIKLPEVALLSPSVLVVH